MDSLDNNIKNENKIPGSPGCDSFTRPEEISALSKFLGNIKRNQEQNLNLNDSLEDIPGKTTGLFPEIKNLNEDYIKLSSGEQSKITELGNTFVPLDAPVFDEEIGSLPQHLVGLNTKNFELNLEDEIVTIEDKRDIELGNELVTIEDSRDTKLEDKLITIEDKRNINLENELVTIEDKREVGLEDTKEELEVNNKIRNLEDEKVKLKVDNEIDKLSKTRVNLSDIRKTKTLEDTKVELGGNLIDPKLNEEKLNLDVNNKDVSLSDKKLKIKVVDSIKKLENTLIDLDVDTEITLNEDLVNLEINEQKLSLGEKQEKLIVENNIENISEYRDNLDVVEPIKALDNSIINLVKDDLFPELDDTKIDLQDVKTKTSLKDEIVKLAKKENEEITSLGDEVAGLDTTSSIIKQISDDIVKLNIEENDIKLEKEVVELDNTKKLTDLNDNIVKLNIEENDIKLEKEVVELNNTTESLDLNNTVVELNNVDTVSNLSNTVITLDNTDDISELGNILVDLENVNTVNKLENDVVTIDLGDNVTELSNVIELLIGTDSTTSLSDYIEKMGDSISPANQNNHDWFDNTEDSNENLIYSEKDKQKLSTIIGNSDLPIESRDGSYDWVDNTVDKNGNPKTLNLGKIEFKQVIENINTDISNDIVPDPDSEYDWFDNREGSGEELLYEIGDEEKLNTTINDNDLPLKNRNGNYDWIDNTIDIDGNPRTIDLNKIKSKQDKKIVDTDISNDTIPDPDSEYDWFDNTPDSDENLIYTEDDRVDLSTTISDDDLPLLSQTKKDKDHDWIDNRVKDSGSPETLDQDTLESKKSRKDIDTDLSDNIIPRLDSDYDWFDNTPDSDENLIYTEDDKELIKTNISFNEIPRINTNNPYDWFDNRVDDGGNSINETKDTLDSTKEKLLLGTSKLPGEDEVTNPDWINNRYGDINIDDYIDEILLDPKIVNTKKQGQELININYIDIRSKADGEPVNPKSTGKFVDNLHKEILDTDLSDNIIPDPESNYKWLNNSNTDEIKFELGDNYLEMKSPIVGQSEYTISDLDIPRLPTAGEDSYKYKYSNLGKIDVDNNLHYKYVKSLEEIDLYNEILNFKYSFIPPSVIGISEGSRVGTRLDNGLDAEYDRFGKDPEVLEPEWLLFIKAITTAYLRPGEDEKIDLDKLESFKDSILSLIRSNKVLREKGLLKIKTPKNVSYRDDEGKLKYELDYGKDNGWISLDLIPEKNRGKDYSWIDNRVKDSGSPETLSTAKIKSKQKTEKLDTDLSDDIIPRLDSNSNYDWFDNTDSSSGKLPKYMKHGPRSELPGFDNKGLDLISREYSLSNYLRFAAEWALGKSFDLLFTEDKFEEGIQLLKELRRKLLEETLAALIVGRDALEKLMKSQKYRLPGDDDDKWYDLLGEMALSGDLSLKGLVRNVFSEYVSPETDKPTNRPQEITTKWKSYSMKPGEGDYYKDGEKVVDKNGVVEYNSHYLQGEGIKTTLTELCGFQKIEDVKSVEDFYTLLKTSPYFTTSNKVTTTDSGYKVMTLDSNAHWEIILEPYIGSLNNNYTFLPLIEEINIRNKELHGILTNYNHWIPIISFELQKERLYSRSLGLFNGEINYPITMEAANEFRITLADDQYKSWRNYFERCAQASVYSSTPNVYDKIKDTTIVKPITVDKEYRLVAPYKNITFRCKVLVMTPQLSTINRYDLLLVLKDVAEERSGEIDSSGTDLNISFSIVGENPGDEISNSRFSKVKSDKDSINKVSTWRDVSESKGKDIANAILNSALSIL